MLIKYTERLFVRVNHKNELYFSMISFQNEENRVYVSEINISSGFLTAKLIFSFGSIKYMFY